MTTPNIEHSSSSWCQSRLLRAGREASRLSTKPALPSPISAIRRWNPLRSEADAPDLPRSSSITAIRSRGQPRPAARSTKRYCSSALLVLAYLHGRGLADVNIGELGPVGGAHAIRRPFRCAQHGTPPPISVAAGGPRLGPVAAATGPGASAMALGAVLGAGVETGSGGDGTASAGSALEAASMLRTRRASGSNVRADTRGTGSSVAHAERSRSVAARRIRRRRPSGKATAMKRGPRAQRRDRTVRRWPTRGCRGSVTVTAEIRRSAAGAARRVEFREDLVPGREGLVGGDQQAAALVAFGDQLEQGRGLRLVLADVAQVVEHQQVAPI